MTKKKTTRVKHQKEASLLDTSEEEVKDVNYQGRVCQHVARGLNFPRVKKILKAANITTCGGCADSPAENDELPEVWVCLQCGNRGCGRMSTNKHALQHFKTIHSDCHALVLSSASGVVWCYDCDNEVNLQQSRSLKECVEFLVKQKGTKSNFNVKKSSATVQQSLLETVLREQTAVNSVLTKSVDSKSNSKNKKESPSSTVVKGLRNLGNTCFFNAVMQNLNQTHLLFQTLESACASDYTWEIPHLTINEDSIVEDTNKEPIKIVIPRQFPLAMSLLNFFKQMNASSSIKNEIINPSSLFSEIAKKCPQFKHFQEQDSHELLRQLLDGIRQDEVKRQKKAILKQFIANSSIEDINDETKKLIKAYSCYALHTLVENIFGGFFISTVLCEECKMSSQVFEPFMDISLPLFEEKHQDNCNQPFLDGGQQQDSKPLRNRKAGADSDETNEFILNKAKKDSGKPSKYQERKMKQQAKKEKKKKNSRGKKTLEATDNPLQVEEEESQKNCSISNEDKENIDELKRDELEDEYNLNSLDNKHSLISEGEESASFEAPFNEDRLLKAEELCEVKDETGEVINSCKTFSTTELKEEDNSTELLQSVSNKLDEIMVLNDFHQTLVADRSHTNQTVPNSKLEHLVLFGEEVLLDMQVQNNPLGNCDDDNDVEKSLETITDDLKILNLSVSSMNSTEPEEKIQSLGLQIKEARIRRDSDRQGSILDSSQSLNDETTHPSSDSREDTYGEESDGNWSYTFSENQTKEWISKSLLTLKPRLHISANECSIDSCLTFFTKPELLTGNNKFRCEKCTEIKFKRTGNKNDVVYSNASKQLLIFSPPAILTLHLKRFQQVGMNLRKVNRFVEFPVTLDLASYCSSACLLLPHMANVQNEILYSLYGVVEHSGRLSSGHYTAYVKATKRTLNNNFMCHLPLAQCDLEQLLKKFSKISSGERVDLERTYPSEDGRWFYVSDAHVREVNEAQVLRCQAYLLFYERIK